MADFSGGSNVPIESARRNADRLGINYDALPQMPFWSRLFGSSDDYVKTRVATKVMASSASVGRELTQSEKDAMAYHLYVYIYICTYTFVHLWYGSGMLTNEPLTVQNYWSPFHMRHHLQSEQPMRLRKPHAPSLASHSIIRSRQGLTQTSSPACLRV